MRIHRKWVFDFLRTIVLAKFFGRRTPFFVSWALTHRCNSRCVYCAMPFSPRSELDLVQIEKIIDILARRGCRFISFTGGEPLLRDDIGKIVDRAYDRGIGAKLNTNGMLFPERIGELGHLTAMMLSFDGPEPIHDRLRGAGSYAGVMRAVETAKQHQIPLSFYTVLSEVNLGSVRDILEIAGRLHVKVLFQPATRTLYGGSEPDPVTPVSPKYREVLNLLLSEKKKRSNMILNSPGGLIRLRSWPEPGVIRCTNGLLGCRIEPDGQVCLCSLTERHRPKTVARAADFEASFDALPLHAKCPECWCAAQIEMGRVAEFKWDAIANAMGLF